MVHSEGRIWSHTKIDDRYCSDSTRQQVVAVQLDQPDVVVLGYFDASPGQRAEIGMRVEMSPVDAEGGMQRRFTRWRSLR